MGEPTLVLTVTPEAIADDTRFVHTLGVDAHSAVAKSTARATQGNRAAPYLDEVLVEPRHVPVLAEPRSALHATHCKALVR
jgi:hypothetical protein